MNTRSNPNPDTVLRATATVLCALLLALAVANHEARDFADPSKHVTYTRTVGGLLLPPPGPLTRSAEAQVEATIAAVNRPLLVMEPVQNAPLLERFEPLKADPPKLDGTLPLYDAPPPAK